MANNVRGPQGMKGAPMAGQKVNGKALKRLAKQLFRDYPVQLTVVLICIALSALVGIAPAVYIETITGYIEEGLTSSWDDVSAKIFSAITTMVILYALHAAHGARDAGLPAQNAHADVRRDAKAAHLLL